MWIETISRHPLLYKPLDINPNEMVVHKLRTTFNVTAFDAQYVVLTTKFERVKAFERFGHVYTLNPNKTHVDHLKECKYKLIFDNKKTRAIQYSESIQLNGSNSKVTIFVSNESIFGTKTEFELQQISITSNRKEINESFFHFDENSKCIALNKRKISDIPSTRKDIIETLLNAKYQIKYCDIFQLNLTQQYGKEYAFNALETFSIPIELPADVGDYNQINLMIAPFVTKTAAAEQNVQGKWLKYQSDLDDNGVFYALGTNFNETEYSNPAKDGILKIVLSQDLEEHNAQKHCLVDRSRVNFMIQGRSKKDQPFFYVNIGRYGLKPTRYTLRNSDKDNGYLMTWELLASNDGVEWITLKQHINTPNPCTTFYVH